jgi:hypoxanthine-DNA glycosylase
MPTHQKRTGRQDAGTVKHSLAPVVDRDVRVLILGSLPGERSLSAGRYYAHPQNQFWRLMSAVLEEDLVALDYNLRLARLLIRHVGLWDVVASARRAGSTDAALRDISVNDIAALIATLPELRAIGFNGGASYTHGMRQIGAATARYAMHALPSSSPMHTIGLDAKRSAWLALTPHLR